MYVFEMLFKFESLIYLSIIGIWGQWQNAGTPDGPPSSTAANHPQPHGASGAGPQQQQELSDMLQMLDQGGASSFEDLSMFNTFPE